MTTSRLLLLALGLSSASAALAQRQPIYQPIGAETDDKYVVSLTQPLLILLPVSPSEAVLTKEYKAPADRASYLADLAAQRAALLVAAKSWHLAPVTFRPHTPAAFDSLQADRQATHLVLYFGMQDFGRQGSVALFPALKLGLLGEVNAPKTLFKRTYDAQVLAYQLFNTNTKVLAVQRFPFWSTVFHASDLISTVQQLQPYLTQRLQGQKARDISQAAEQRVGQQAALLPTKTLLLARTQIGAQLPETKLRQLYPFPLQLTDQAAVEVAVAAADPRYLYLRFVTTNGYRGFQLLDAASGQVVGYSAYTAIRADSFGRIVESDVAEVVKTASKH